ATIKKLPPRRRVQSLPLGQQYHLRLGHHGDQLAVLAGDARGPHRGAFADMHRRASPVTVMPSFAAPMKLVLLSIVVVLASRGMLSTAPMAPSASANAMIAPPCMMWPAVHRSGRTTSRARTLSGSALRISTPIRVGKGWFARIRLPISMTPLFSPPSKGDILAR